MAFGVAYVSLGLALLGVSMGISCSSPKPPPVRPGAVDAAPAVHGCVEACDHFTAQLHCDMEFDACVKLCGRLTVNEPGYPDCMFGTTGCGDVDRCLR